MAVVINNLPLLQHTLTFTSLQLVKQQYILNFKGDVFINFTCNI